MEESEFEVGSFLVVNSRIESTTHDIGIVTIVYSADEFIAMLQLIGRSSVFEKNILGKAIRVATCDERSLLPLKLEGEETALYKAQHVADKLHIDVNITDIEYQFDGKILFVYCVSVLSSQDNQRFVKELYDALSLVDTRVIVKVNEGSFIPFKFAQHALATGSVVTVYDMTDDYLYEQQNVYKHSL